MSTVYSKSIPFFQPHVAHPFHAVFSCSVFSILLRVRASVEARTCHRNKKHNKTPVKKTSSVRHAPQGNLFAKASGAYWMHIFLKGREQVAQTMTKEVNTPDRTECRRCFGASKSSMYSFSTSFDSKRCIEFLMALNVGKRVSLIHIQYAFGA